MTKKQSKPKNQRIVYIAFPKTEVSDFVNIPSYLRESIKDILDETSCDGYEKEELIVLEVSYTPVKEIKLPNIKTHKITCK